VDRKRTSTRSQSFGEQGLTLLDRLGNWLSKRAISKHLPKAPHPYVLDLGCGYGALLLKNISRSIACTAHAVDLRLDPALSEEFGFKATEGAIPEVLSRLPGESVDLLLLISVLEHLEFPLAVLQECQRVLKPEGKMLINVPTWRGRWFLELAAFKLGLCPAEEIEDHKTYYEISSLWPLLVEARFKPSRLEVKRIKFGLTIFAVAQKSQ